MLVTSLIALLPAIAAAQVSGTVGPRTSASAKAAEKGIIYVAQMRRKKLTRRVIV